MGFFLKIYFIRVYQNDCKIRYMSNSKEEVVAWFQEYKPKLCVIVSKALCGAEWNTKSVLLRPYIFHDKPYALLSVVSQNPNLTCHYYNSLLGKILSKQDFTEQI